MCLLISTYYVQGRYTDFQIKRNKSDYFVYNRKYTHYNKFRILSHFHEHKYKTKCVSAQVVINLLSKIG